MLRSALLNVMLGPPARPGRTLKRDFGEVEHLQVSLKGPANFVTAADRRAEEILHQELTKARPGYGFLGEEGGRARGRRQDPYLDRRSARRHHQFPARHPAIRHLDRARARRHDRRGPDLQSRERRAVHRRARQGRIPQRPAGARRGAPAARRRGRGLRPAASRPRRPGAVPPGVGGACRRRSPGCADSARRRSTSPGSRPAVSMPTGSATSRRGTSRPASCIVREAGGFVSDLDGGERMLTKGNILAGNETMHRELLRLLQGGAQTERASRAGASMRRADVFSPRLCHIAARIRS